MAPPNRTDFDAHIRSAVRLPVPRFDTANVRNPVRGVTQVTFKVETADAVLAKCIADRIKSTIFTTYTGDVTRVRYGLVFDMPR